MRSNAAGHDNWPAGAGRCLGRLESRGAPLRRKPHQGMERIASHSIVPTLVTADNHAVERNRREIPSLTAANRALHGQLPDLVWHIVYHSRSKTQGPMDEAGSAAGCGRTSSSAASRTGGAGLVGSDLGRGAKGGVLTGSICARAQLSPPARRRGGGRPTLRPRAAQPVVWQGSRRARRSARCRRERAYPE